MGKSMTGYGRTDIQMDDTKITIEMKSVNHRFLDVNMKIPLSFMYLEERLKKIVQSYFQRGKIDIYVRVDGKGFTSRKLETDWHLMDQYMSEIKEIKMRYQLSGDVSTAIIPALNEIFTVQELESQSNQFKDQLIDGLKEACRQVVDMREEEGNHLIHDLQERIHRLNLLINQVKNRRTFVVDEYRERIKDRVNQHLTEDMDLNASRIYQEIVLLAEKGDIAEEITRLISHTSHFMRTIESESGDSIGRRLDFITQELHREANTIGSKSTDSTISEYTVAIKGEVEKIKEQVQNIE
ncbi:YicC family protein [Virgibacillus salarius]|uniref:YicC/YloC family endoribonuclease n=1 Tax=Virgibacillus salarius TaxID=447199 RepID=UPI0024918994|nr:YicC/YloC family endoribonuclease [Virgibacillus salarius]WBX79620.1 YicC family protein [Virgibacillus salarius]